MVVPLIDAGLSFWPEEPGGLLVETFLLRGCKTKPAKGPSQGDPDAGVWPWGLICPARPPLAPTLGVQVGEGLPPPQTGAQGRVFVWGCSVLFCSVLFGSK